MSFSAGILFVFIVAAQAQPSSPVRSAISASSKPLSEVISALDEGGKARALEALDRLDKRVLDSAALVELSEAYRLLGRPEDALKAARALSAREPGNADGEAQAIMAHAQSGDYGAAEAAAEAGLKRFPGDKNLLALLHQVKGRAASSPQIKLPGIPRTTEPHATAAASDNRTFVLPITTGKNVPSPSGIEKFNISSGEAGAPPATLWDRFIAFITPDDRLIEADLSLLRTKASDFTLPSETSSLATTTPEVPRQFVQWLKSMKPEDLPPIEYGIVSPGDYAEYRKGLGRGKIVMSHSIRDYEPEARSTALMHELFHYWDMKVAKNSYQTETYGYTSPENEGDREYDPYLLTAHFWQHVRPQGAASPMAKSFDRLPLDGEEVRRKVDSMIERKRSRRE